MNIHSNLQIRLPLLSLVWGKELGIATITSKPKPSLCEGGGGARVCKNTTKVSSCLKDGFFLVEHLLGYCRPLTIFQRSCKVDSNSSSCFSVFLWGNKNMQLPNPPFFWCYSLCNCNESCPFPHVWCLRTTRWLLQLQQSHLCPEIPLRVVEREDSYRVPCQLHTSPLMRKKKPSHWGKGILERWWSRCTRNLSPYLDNNCPDRICLM